MTILCFQRLLWLLLLVSGLACQSEGRRVPAAPVANMVHPVVYIPTDVDLVLRLNVRSYRETMGPEPEAALARLWQNFGPQSVSASESREPLIRLLRGCDSLWLGCRLDDGGCRDYVFVLRGHWSGTLHDYAFGTVRNRRDLGRGWLSVDFPTTQRSSIARLYWRGPELSVLVSSAELDSVERALEHSNDATRLEPSEDGIMSLVARSSGLARLARPRSPKAAEWLEQSEQVEIRFEPLATGTVATFTITFGDEKKAQLSAQAFRVLVTALSGFDARFSASHVILEQLGPHVVLRVSIPAAKQSSKIP